MISMWFFRLVVFHIPHASYAYQNIGYVTDVKEIYAEKNQLPSMTSKRIHDLI